MTDVLKRVFIQNAASSAKMSVIVILLLCLTIPVTRRYRAGWRYYSWLAVMLVFMIPFSMLGIGFSAKTPIVTESAEKTGEWISEHTPMYEVTVENPFYVEPDSHERIYDPTIPVAQPTVTYRKQVDITLILSIIWLIAAVIFFAAHIRRYLTFISAAKRYSEPVTDEIILSMLAEEKRRMGINAKISVRKSSVIDTPMLTGIFKPLLLLPDDGFTADELRLVLVHELTHYRRRDIPYQFITLIFLSLHWFNPFAYIMAKAAEIDGETSCDEAVLDRKPYETRVFYGEMLLKFLRINNQKRSYMTTTFFGGKKGMNKRLTLIASGKTRKKGMTAMAALLAATIGVSVTAAAAQPWDEEMLRLFNNPTQELMDMIDANVSLPQAKAESNGVTVEVKQTITDNHGIYVLLEVTTPEGTIIPKDARWNDFALYWNDGGIGFGTFGIDTLRAEGNKATMLCTASCDGICGKEQKVTLNLADLVVYNDPGEGMEKGLIKEVVANCSFNLEWTSEHSNLSKIFLTDKVYTDTNGTGYKIEYIEISPISILVRLESDSTWSPSPNPAVHTNDGKEYELAFSNIDGYFSDYKFRKGYGGGNQVGEFNFGLFFDHIEDVYNIKDVTVGDVVIPIEFDKAVEIPIVSEWARKTVESETDKINEMFGLGVYDFTRNITKLQFCTLAYQTLTATGDYPTYEPAPFTDVMSSGCVEAMYAAGIIDGRTDTLFAPDDELTREEAAVVLYRMAGLYEKAA